MQICCTTHSLILNAMTHSTHAHSKLSTAPTMTVKLSLFTHTHTPVHSPWMPAYIIVMQTILISLKMVGLFISVVDNKEKSIKN